MHVHACIWMCIRLLKWITCMYDCPNQNYGRVRISLPKSLNERWRELVGGDKRREHKYDVAKAVHQAGSNGEEFLACWRRYLKAGRRKKNQAAFYDDVFQRFSDAGFGRTGDSSAKRLQFVVRMLREHREPVQVQCVCECVCVCLRMFV